MLYFASAHLKSSFRIVIDKPGINLTDLVAGATELPISYDGQMLTVVASKSHLNAETENYINSLKADHGGLNLVSKGSSLKFCLIAEGSADIYPRFAPTYEWDSAAAQAIIEIAGGAVIGNDNNAPLRYNKENLLNPGFIAYRKYPAD
jgi:3'(2'), 5'-bisphosphate nucleotidase